MFFLSLNVGYIVLFLQVCSIGVEKTRLQCAHCGDCFKTRTTLIKHLTKHGAPIPDELKKRPYKKRIITKDESGEGSTEMVEDQTEGVMEVEGQEVQIVMENSDQVVHIEPSTENNIVQHAIQLQEIQQGGGDAAILLQRIASQDGEEAEALETALQLVQLEFIPGPAGGSTAHEGRTIQVVAEDGSTIQEAIIGQVEEVQEEVE